MKANKFFKSALLAAILLIGGNAWGETAIYDWTTQTGTSGNIDDNISFTTERNSSSNAPAYNKDGEIRFYFHSTGNGGSITLLPLNGAIITDVVMTASGTGYTPTVKYNVDGQDDVEATLSGTTYTISGISAGATLKIRNANTTNTQLRVKSITVTYSISASSVATPEFSPSSGTYTEAQNVEITCATEGATIYYTTNGDDPSAASTEYSGAISVSTTTTLKAIAIKDGESSSIASATYTFPKEVANIAAFNATTKGDFVKITGTISIIFSDGNSSVYAQDASGSMLIYDFNYAKTEGLTNGKTLTGLVGTTDNYNGPQMTNVIAPALGEGTPVEPAVVSEVTVDDLHKFVKLENVQFTETCDLSERRAQGTLTSGLLVYNNLYNVSLGTAIQGKNYDIEGFVSVYKDAAQLYPISLEVNEPAFYYSENSLAFGPVENNQSKELTFTLRGEKLTADATLAVSGDNAAMFTVSPESLTKADDGTIAETTITVTYTPTGAGAHTANLTITSDELVSTIALSGEGILPVLTAPVATAATTITANSFVATWGEVPNATSYEVSVWKKTGETAETEVGNANLDGWSYKTDGTYTSSNNYGQSSPSIKFAKTGNYIETRTYSSPIIEFSFWCKGQGSELTSTLLIEGYNGSEWKQIDNITTLPTTGTQKTYNALAENFYKIKLTFTKESGNLAIDDIAIVPQTEEAVSGSPFTVSGATNLAITGLTAETNYRYSVVAKADGYTDSEASNIIDVTTSKGSGTGLCHPATLEGVSFDGQVIRNAAGLELSVYTVSGVCVKTAAGDIDMSAMPHGIYLVRSANAVLKITK